MRLISSAFTGFHKLFTLLLMAVGIALFTVGTVAAVVHGNEPLIILMFPIAFVAFGFFLWRHMTRLVDSVCIDGTDFVIWSKNAVERIPLSQALEAESSIFLNPDRIVLTLREPCRFGETITFLPPMRFFRPPFSPHPLAAELNDLIRQVTYPDLHTPSRP